MSGLWCRLGQFSLSLPSYSPLIYQFENIKTLISIKKDIKKKKLEPKGPKQCQMHHLGLFWSSPPFTVISSHDAVGGGHHCWWLAHHWWTMMVVMEEEPEEEEEEMVMTWKCVIDVC